MPTEKLLAARYEKFRRMGRFLEGDAAESRAKQRQAGWNIVQPKHSL